MPRTSPLCNYFVFFKYITNSRCLSTLFSALCCFGAQFTILSLSPPALLGTKRRAMYPPLRVPYSLIGRGTLCARQPMTPTTLWGLNSPALQTLFSACPSHQETAGANRPGCPFLLISKAIPHNSKCRYGERGAADAKPKAQIILDAAKVSAASGGNSEPKQGQRSQSARGFCPRSTMRVPQPDIIEHFGNADAVPQPPKRCLSC